jgi:hypothetical protein
MTEPPALPPPEPQDEQAAPAPVERPAARHSFRWLTAAGFVLLALALVWVWRHPSVPAPPTEQVDAMAQQVGTLEARVARLEQRPSPAVPDLAPLTARVAALEQRPPAPAPQPAAAPDLGPLEARIAALEQRKPPSLGPLEARIAALEAKQPADSQLTSRIDALEAAQRTSQAELARRVDANDKLMSRVAQVQAARLALDAGQKLREVPGMPAALARFTNTAPPTEASLRLSFPKAQRDALAAARPDTEGRPLLARLWAQAQDLVTIRQGDHVLVGDPDAGALERARAALEAGDLPGAVTEVGSLHGPAAQAMSGWLAEARALLEARAALAMWAAQA